MSWPPWTQISELLQGRRSRARQTARSLDRRKQRKQAAEPKRAHTLAQRQGGRRLVHRPCVHTHMRHAGLHHKALLANPERDDGRRAGCSAAGDSETYQQVSPCPSHVCQLVVTQTARRRCRAARGSMCTEGDAGLSTCGASRSRCGAAGAAGRLLLAKRRHDGPDAWLGGQRESALACGMGAEGWVGCTTSATRQAHETCVPGWRRRAQRSTRGVEETSATYLQLRPPRPRCPARAARRPPWQSSTASAACKQPAAAPPAALGGGRWPPPRCLLPSRCHLCCRRRGRWAAAM